MPLIVLEGPEGAGKTTQVRMLAEWLGANDQDVIAAREPGGTPLGDEIRRLLLDTKSDIVPRAESLLYMASRAQLTARELVPALKADRMVILDRFFLATYAYQVAGRGLPQDEIVTANRLAVEELRPDLTLLLMLPVKEGLARAKARGGVHDRIEREDSAFHQRVADAFAEIATAEWQHAHPEAGPIEIVNARGSVEEVFERVLAALAERWPGIFAARR